MRIISQFGATNPLVQRRLLKPQDGEGGEPDAAGDSRTPEKQKLNAAHDTALIFDQAIDLVIDFFNRIEKRRNKLKAKLESLAETEHQRHIQNYLDDYDTDFQTVFTQVRLSADKSTGFQSDQLENIAKLLRLRADMRNSLMIIQNQSEPNETGTIAMLRNAIAARVYDLTLTRAEFPDRLKEVVDGLADLYCHINSPQYLPEQLTDSEMEALDAIASYCEGSFGNKKLGRKIVFHYAEEARAKQEYKDLNKLTARLNDLAFSSDFKKSLANTIQAYIDLESTRLLGIIENDPAIKPAYEIAKRAYLTTLNQMPKPLPAYFGSVVHTYEINTGEILN